MKKSICLFFMITNITLFFFWIVAFIEIESFEFLLKNANYFRWANIAYLAVSVAIPILVFKLNLEKLLSRYEEAVPVPNPDKYLLLFAVELLSCVFIGGFIYATILNINEQEITQINLLRLYHIPFLTWGSYFGFIVNYLSFRYLLSKSKEDS